LTYNKNIIQSSVPELWTFLDFTYANGNNPIEEWYTSELSVESRFMFDDLLKNNSKIKDHLHWIGFRGYLSGKASKEKIWELGFKCDRRQYRLLGVFREGARKQAVLLIGCYHKNQVYTPANALNTAITRSKAFSEGKASYRERKNRTDR